MTRMTLVTAAASMALLGLMASWATAGLPPAHSAPEVPPCGWLPPVAAPVVDPFRPPPHPYGPGNRGIEYGVVPGDTVVAVADGRVAFAGPVGGRRYVVVEHDGGLRSTYGPLEVAGVVRGQPLAAGQEIGSAGEGLHLTARIDERYLDPQPLIDGACLRPRLVPLPEPGRPVVDAGVEATLGTRARESGSHARSSRPSESTVSP